LSKEKFFHEEVTKKVEREDTLKTYVTESIEGVYETFTKISTELDTQFQRVNNYVKSLDVFLTQMQEEIIELNKYLKDLRGQVDEMKKTIQFQTFMIILQYIGIAVLTAFVLVGCSPATRVVFTQAPSPISVIDIDSQQRCVKTVSTYEANRYLDSYAKPCNVNLEFKTRSLRR